MLRLLGNTAKSELEKQERQVYEERKKREMELAEVRKEAEEKRLQHERIERRIVGFFLFCKNVVNLNRNV